MSSKFVFFSELISIFYRFVLFTNVTACTHSTHLHTDRKFSFRRMIHQSASAETTIQENGCQTAEHNLVHGDVTPQPARIQWSDWEPKESVLIAGDFWDWKGFVRLPRDENGQFGIDLELVPGTTWQFKFVVDGVWQFSEKYPLCKSPIGSLNNFITISS